MRVTNNILAYAHVHGTHDNMRKPFAPVRCAIQMHIKPNKRWLWDTRSEPGFNLGTLMEHHRCFCVYITRTQMRVSDTVFFKHQYITNPTISPESHVVAAAQQLATALKGNIPAGHNSGSTYKGQRIIHKNCAGKVGPCKSKGTTQLAPGQPSSKGNSTTSKGGRGANSKGGCSHQG